MPGAGASSQPNHPTISRSRFSDSPNDVRSAVPAPTSRTASLSAGGSAVVQIMAPEALRAEFQRAEADRIVKLVAELDSFPKQILRLLAALDGRRLFQKAIAERLGRSYGGGAQSKTMRDAVEALGDLVTSDGNGVRANVRERIAADLAAYQATDADVEATYQRVLYELATGSGE